MISPALRQKLPALVALTRLNRPIGIYLLLWPALWALWFAAQGMPDPAILAIFVLGTILTRSAGCAINDYTDREFDGHVARTRNRPLATGELQPKDALITTAVLMGIAFLLVLMTNTMTIALSFGALLLALTYPLAKRYTHLPQFVLGLAFGMAVPMAFTAQTESLPLSSWLLYAAAISWAMAYDTLYAMADRDDDLKVGIKSTAILFGRHDLMAVAVLQLLTLALLVLIGWLNSRGLIYYAGLAGAIGFVVYQLRLSSGRDPVACLHAFLNNHWLGLCVFAALVLDYYVYSPG